MALWKVEFSIPHHLADAVSDALDGGPFGPLAITSIEDKDSPGNRVVQTGSRNSELQVHGQWLIEALYDRKPDPAAISRLIAPVAEAHGASFGPVQVSLVPDTDWIAKSLEGLAPVAAGRFFVYGHHDALKVPAHTIPILIDAGQAFGTGHHATTQGCLEYVSELCATRRPRNVLDIGTGTGVLAIGLAKLARVRVLASDIDPVAMLVARSNAKLNGVGNLVHAVTASGFGHPLLAAHAPYDLILANILASPLVSLAPAFARHLSPGGTLILSGILLSQENMVTSALRSHGLYLHSRKRIGDWVSLRVGA